MGQYFRIFNHTKEAFITPTILKPVEVVTTPLNGGTLLYLLDSDIPADEDPHGLAGSWIGDEIRIQGDYHPSRVMDNVRPRSRISFNGDTYTTDTHVNGPVNPDKSDVDVGEPFYSGWTNLNSSHSLVTDSDTGIWFESGNVEPGDYGIVNPEYLDVADIDGDASGIIVKVEESLGPKWEDFTEQAMDAYKAFVGDGNWLEVQEDMTAYNPDIVITQDEDGEKTVFSGSLTIIRNHPDGEGSQHTRQQHIDSFCHPDGGDDIIIANLNNNQYFHPTETSSHQQALASPVTNGMIVYLLLDSVQDGTRFTGLHNPYAPELEEEMSAKMAKERERTRNTGRTSLYRNDDGSWDKPELARAVTANHMIADDFLFAGQWAGDDIRVCNTTADLAVEIIENGFDITDRLREVFSGFVSQEWIDDWEYTIPNTADNATPAEDVISA